MDEHDAGYGKRLPKHLIAPETLARAAVLGRDADLTRHHGQSNGMRVHALYFAAVSLVALAMVLAAVAFASTMG